MALIWAYEWLNIRCEISQSPNEKNIVTESIKFKVNQISETIIYSTFSTVPQAFFLKNKLQEFKKITI